MIDIRELTDRYAVSPQIAPGDVVALKAAGFDRVICNRPDSEVGPDLAADALRAAVEEAGLTWIDNPVSGGGITPDNVVAQRAAVAPEAGKVFAYCRSGTRSTIVWAFAVAGTMPVDEIIAAAARGGYDLTPYRAQIEALAAAG